MSQIIAQNDQCEIRKKLRKKIFGLVSNFKFWVILGQISNFSQGRELIYQNDALGVNLPKKVVARSQEVTRGQKYQ